MEYSLTQRLFFRHLHPKACSSGDLPAPTNGILTVPPTYTECGEGGDSDAWITWKLAAKYFFAPYFGGAASPFRRNVLASTLDLTGVAFLNGPRNTSPLISRLKVRRIFQASGTECLVHFQPCRPGNQVQPAAPAARIRRPHQAWAKRWRECRLRLYPECLAVWRHPILLQLGLLWAFRRIPAPGPGIGT
jgi:hypothetical protein